MRKKIVEVKINPFPQILCIDEVYAVKYQQKVYACVLVNFVTRQIYDLLPDRRKYHLTEYFSKIDRFTRIKVRYISMDMWDTYRDTCSIYFPKAKICVDRFRVVKLVTHAFTQVRIRVMKTYPASSDEYYLLKKFHWLLNKDYADIPPWKTVTVYRNVSFLHTKYQHATSLLNTMLSLNPELEIGYMLKDTYLQLNKRDTSENVAEKLDCFLEDLYTLNIPEFNSIGKTIKKWHQEIINSFDTYDGRRISNGPIESVNSRIKLIKRNANGYKNFDRFRKRVLYSLNSNSTIKF